MSESPATAAYRRLALAGVLALAAVPAQARTLAEVRESGTLRLCVAGSSADFYQANGEEFARFLGVKPEVKRLARFEEQFQNAQGVTVRGEEYVPKLLADGSCDVFPNDLQIVDWRESKMRLVPYYNVRSVVIAHQDLAASLKRVADLAGRRAAVQKGTNYDDWLVRANAAELASRPVDVVHASTAEAVRMVADRKADFTIVGTEGALRWVREAPGLVVLFPVDEPLQAGWGILPVATLLEKELQRFFAESRRSGSGLGENWRRQYNVSLNEYELYAASFGEGKFDLRTFLAWALPSLGGLAVVLAAILLWNRRLQREIRERQAAEKALRTANERLDLAQDAGHVGVFDVVIGGRNYWTPPLERMFGLQPGTFSGTVDAWAALLHPEDRDRARQAFEQALSDKECSAFTDEFRVVRPDGAVRWFQSICHIFRTPGGRATRAVGVNIDATELVSARRTAEEATRAKSMFLATMSHEIRTPMNGVLGLLQLLGFSRLDADQKNTLEGASDSAKSLLRIIDDLLDFSKIEAGRLEIRPEPASIPAVIESVRQVYSGVASGKDLTLSTSVDPALSPALKVDPLRLRQILNNFASNAIKFTSRGSVDIAVKLVERANGSDTLRFSVTDTGIGVSKEAQARLFEPYAQATADTARQFGGTGLGLTICRRLADMMGGEIAMQSEPGRGTVMMLTLTLPIADPKELKAGPSADATAAMVASRRQAPTVEAAREEGTLILVVEDHPTNRNLVTRLLGLLGYAAETAENGREALAKWSAGRFGLVLTDCNMPEMDGYELTQAIRKRETGGKSRIPVVACTANALAGEIDRCLEAGMDDFVAKPIELEALARAMERWLPLPGAGKRGAPKAAKPAGDGASPLDRSSLAAITGGDRTMEREILADFKAANDADMTALRLALAERDLAKITQASHRVKGACKMVGAVALAGVCERIEKAGRQNSWQHVAIEQPALEHELERLNAWLSAN